MYRFSEGASEEGCGGRKLRVLGREIASSGPGVLPRLARTSVSGLVIGNKGTSGSLVYVLWRKEVLCRKSFPGT